MPKPADVHVPMVNVTAWREGWLCVKCCGPACHEPKRVASWFPIVRMSEAQAADHVGREVTWDRMYPSWLDRTGYRYVPLDGGDTRAKWTEEEVLAPPRPRKSWRWVWEFGLWHAVPLDSTRV